MTHSTDLGPTPFGATPSTQPVGDGREAIDWTRHLSEQVWIECHDEVVAGRIMRTAPTVQLHHDALEPLDVGTPADWRRR